MGSNAQLGYDIGLKLTSYRVNRFQLEQRFHFKDKISVVMDFGMNRNSPPRRDITYAYAEGGPSSLTVNHFVAKFYQVKLGAQKDIINNAAGSRVYAGGSFGLNYGTRRNYLAHAQLSFDIDPETGEGFLVYRLPNSTSEMEFLGTDRLRDFIIDGFCGVDYVMQDIPVVLTMGLHIYGNYLFNQLSIMAPKNFGVETNFGIRYRIEKAGNKKARKPIEV
jgi:hypothetical protein